MKNENTKTQFSFPNFSNFYFQYLIKYVGGGGEGGGGRRGEGAGDGGRGGGGERGSCTCRGWVRGQGEQRGAVPHLHVDLL